MTAQVPLGKIPLTIKATEITRKFQGSGADRRVSLGAPPVGVERRSGADRRSGEDRRSES